MTHPHRILLVNPQITSRRSARFPLSLLAVAGALEPATRCRLIDGNVDRDYLSTMRRTLSEERFDAIGLTVMGGPQVQSAIDVSVAARAACAATPIIWGGYFPTLYTDAAINASYVDYAVRGPGEAIMTELLDTISAGELHKLGSIGGLTWKRGGEIVHNPERAILDHRSQTLLPYHLLGNPRAYLARTFLGRRTAAHQASMGCRYRC
ncbi:MAG TPA: cobalamin B12-binding domain-containing protein, partial [Steroidobacteraceae bacterium]